MAIARTGMLGGLRSCCVERERARNPRGRGYGFTPILRFLLRVNAGGQFDLRHGTSIDTRPR